MYELHSELNDFDKARVLNSIGTVHVNLGIFEMPEKFHKKAFAGVRRALGKRTFEYR